MNQNFTDLINGITDTTKDISINALTTAGTVTMNGNIVVGSSTSKTITLTGSIVANVVVNANGSYDFGGSTLGWKSIYLGSTGSFTTRIVAGATASWTLTLPVTAGSSGQILVTDGSGVTSWQTQSHIPGEASNYSLAISVGSSALTVALKDATGTDCTATSHANISFRNATLATGTTQFRTVTGALSLTVPSTATLGSTNGASIYLYIYALDNAGTVELAILSDQAQYYPLDEGGVYTTTALSVGSTSTGVLYSTSGRANVAIRLIGRLLISEATAGTWASLPTETSLKFENKTHAFWVGNFGTNTPNWRNASLTFADATLNSGTATLTETKNVGFGVVTGAATNKPGITFTPVSSSAIYMVTVNIMLGTSSGTTGDAEARLWDGTNMIASGGIQFTGASNTAPHSTLTLTGIWVPNTASAVTLMVQIASGGSNADISSYFTTPGTRSIEFSLIRLQ